MFYLSELEVSKILTHHKQAFGRHIWLHQGTNKQTILRRGIYEGKRVQQTQQKQANNYPTFGVW
jgi:hypothetical protein